MRIAVLVKQVPDSWADKRLNEEMRLDRASVDSVLNDLDEYAIEAALQIKEHNGAEVTAISMGPESATEALRRALSMGCDAATLISDPQLAGADMLMTAKTLASVAAGFDLVLTGVESTDARGGVVPVMVADLLGYSALTYVDELQVDGAAVSAKRHDGQRKFSVSASLPALVSVIEKANTPRYPNLKGIMAAKKIEIKTLSLAELALSLDASTSVVSQSAVPARERGVIVEGADAVSQLVAFLRERKVI